MKRFAIFLCLIILTACNATTRLSGVVDPNYQGNFQAQKMVVVGFGLPIDEQKVLENTLVESLNKYDVTVLRGLEVFPPTRDYTDKDTYKIARGKGADTILVISADGRDVSETYIPPTYHPGTSTSYVSGYGNFATVNTHTTPGYTSGGYSVSKPGMNVTVYLKNTKNRETIWTADGFSGGNAYASFSDLSISVAKQAVTELANAGLIAEKAEVETDQVEEPSTN